MGILQRERPGHGFLLFQGKKNLMHPELPRKLNVTMQKQHIFPEEVSSIKNEVIFYCHVSLLEG